MLFEDAHWADPTTLEVLELLIGRVRDMPLLVIITHRPEFQPRWVGPGHVTALALSRLSRAQSAAVVAGLANGKPLPPDLLEQIIAKTDGVPLFVEELARSIFESGIVQDAGDHYEYVGSPANVTIPATLRDSLMARLDRVMPVKEIAQIGAAIGREFGYKLIAAIAPMPTAALDDGLGKLVESGLAYCRRQIPEAIYTFKHALVQDAAYDSLLKSRRQLLHGEIARVLEEHFPNAKDSEPELLAHHYTAAGLTDAALAYWRKAGERALERMALNESIAHLRTGLELTATLPPSAERDGNELDLRVLLGTVWMAFRGWPAPEVWTSFHPALDLAKSLGRAQALPPIYWGLWVNVLVQGRIAESLAPGHPASRHRASRRALAHAGPSPARTHFSTPIAARALAALRDRYPGTASTMLAGERVGMMRVTVNPASARSA
jgi:predicted ATPase